MKNLLILLLTLAIQPASAQSTVNSDEREIIFRGVTVIPMDKNQILEDKDVVVRYGKITAINPTGRTKPGKNALIIEAKGKFLMPGLAEMHAHVPPIDDIAPMKDVLKLFVLNGVTTIRGMLGHPRHIELRGMINGGTIMGPHFYTSGPSFNGLSVKSPEGADKMVRDQKAMGYDFLKLHPGLTRANFDAIVKTAKEVKIPYAGHVSSGVGIWHAIESDYATIDHLDGFIEGTVPGIEAMTDQEIGFFGLFASAKANESKIPDLVKGLKAHKTWIVPTQCLAERWIAADKTTEQMLSAPEMKYMDKKTLDSWAENKNRQMSTPGYTAEGAANFIKLRRKLILECQRGGVGMLLGSDAPQVFNVPGYSVHHELRYMVEAGLTPFEALQSGTVNVAAFYGKSSTEGAIKPSYVSDLILLNGNPLLDINQTQNIEGVMMGKYWMDKSYREAELAKLVKN